MDRFPSDVPSRRNHHGSEEQPRPFGAPTLAPELDGDGGAGSARDRDGDRAGRDPGGARNPESRDGQRDSVTFERGRRGAAERARGAGDPLRGDRPPGRAAGRDPHSRGRVHGLRHGGADRAHPPGLPQSHRHERARREHRRSQGGGAARSRGDGRLSRGVQLVVGVPAAFGRGAGRSGRTRGGRRDRRHAPDRWDPSLAFEHRNSLVAFPEPGSLIYYDGKRSDPVLNAKKARDYWTRVVEHVGEVLEDLAMRWEREGYPAPRSRRNAEAAASGANGHGGATPRRRRK